MLKDLFFELYKVWGASLTYLLLLFAYILFPILLWLIIKGFLGYKANPKKSLIQIFTAFLFGILLIPSVSAGINLYGHLNKNEKLQELSINITPLSWQKGVYYIQLGNSKQGAEAIKDYENAYQLIGSYKYQCWNFMPIANYYSTGNYDTAIIIANNHGNYHVAANCYIMKNDYQNALKSINKAIERYPNSPTLYAKRGFIYNNLGEHKAAENDLKTALNKCSDKEREKVSEVYKNWKNAELKRLSKRG